MWGLRVVAMVMLVALSGCGSFDDSSRPNTVQREVPMPGEAIVAPLANFYFAIFGVTQSRASRSGRRCDHSRCDQG